MVKAAIPSVSPANILIVEDEPDMARVNSGLLSEGGATPRKSHTTASRPPKPSRQAGTTW